MFTNYIGAGLKKNNDINMRKVHKTSRLILRKYSPDDYQTWFDAYVNRLPKKNKYDRAPMPAQKCGRRNFSKLMKNHDSLAKKDQVYIYAVFEKKTGILVGAIDLFIMVRDLYQMGSLGYQIHNRYWGKGYGKEAARAGLIIAFKELKLNRIEAAINLDNRRSIRLAKAIGMRREGIKKRYIFENNQWTDNVVFVANPEDIGLKSRPI